MTTKPTICLIIPPSIFLLDERVFMTLGILRVAAVLEAKGYPLEVLDLSGIENFEDALRDHCRTTQAQIFGLTATTPQMPAVHKLAKAIKAEKTAARVILGGPHITLVHTAYKKEQKDGSRGRATNAYEVLYQLFDVLVSGDGEEAIDLAVGENPPKLIDANDRQSPLFLTNQKLESLPYPARHLVEVGSYHYQIEGRPSLSLIAQLGCPFECGFCGGRQAPMLRAIRTRSVPNILQEMETMYKSYGNTGFMFYDDELNVSQSMVELMDGIAALQKKLNADFRLRGFVKAELFNERQAEAMVRAGFRWILTGFESGSPRILTNINKKATQEQNSRCVEIAKKYGLKVKALMSVGHPGESKETIMETHDWLLQVKPDDFDVTIITTYPGTPYYDFAVPHPNPKMKNVWVYTYEKTGDNLYSYEVDYNVVADYYKGDPNGGYKAYVYTDQLSAEALVELRDFVERNVREKLNIPFNAGAPARRYEHSMGQFGKLPDFILKIKAA
jgi:anaerobic magnesium-protoporphyrin IX monomethyl ester cyclase